MRLSERLSVLVLPLLGCFWMLFDYQQCLCMWSVTVQDSEGSYVILLRLQWQQLWRKETCRARGGSVTTNNTQNSSHVLSDSRAARQARGLMNAQRYAVWIQNDWANFTKTPYNTPSSQEKKDWINGAKTTLQFQDWFIYLYYLLHFDMMTIKQICVCQMQNANYLNL